MSASAQFDSDDTDAVADVNELLFLCVLLNTRTTTSGKLAHLRSATHFSSPRRRRFTQSISGLFLLLVDSAVQVVAIGINMGSRRMIMLLHHVTRTLVWSKGIEMRCASGGHVCRTSCLHGQSTA